MKKIHSLRSLLCTLLASLSLGLSVNVQAAFPDKPIKIVIGFPAGGPLDTHIRLLTDKLQGILGQPVLVDYKAGAGGTVGALFVAQAPADGYTLLLANTGTLVINPAIYTPPPYILLTDFQPVARTAQQALGLIVNNEVPVKTLKEFIAYAKANPGKLNFGSHSGVTQLMFSRMSKQHDLQMNLIPYKGEAPNVNDLLGGHVQFTLVSTISTMQHIHDGKLTPIAMMLDKRLSLLPEVPTFAEAGLPSLGAESWAALFGPAKLAPEIATRMSQAIRAAIADPEVRARIERQGFDLAGTTPAELGAYMVTQLKDWKQAFNDVGLKPE